MTPLKLPPVDQTKLNASYAAAKRAQKYQRWARTSEELANKLRREHYREQYDQCKCCGGRGCIGEGLGIQTCGYCNAGLVPKGAYGPGGIYHS